MSESNKDRCKKLRERFFLEEFFEAAGKSLQIVEERETPDFILRNEGGDYGVELAEVFKDRRSSGPKGKLASPGKDLESQRSAYLRQMSSDYYARGGRPIQVQALLPDGFDFPPQSQVVECLLADRPTQVWEQRRIEFGPAAILYLTALPEEVGNYSRWTPVNNSVGWRRQTRLDDLQEVVRAKSGKLADCRRVCERVVLLLHADGTRASGMISWSADFSPIESCGFDEVWLYLHPGDAWRLWPSPAQILRSEVGTRTEAG